MDNNTLITIPTYALLFEAAIEENQTFLSPINQRHHNNIVYDMITFTF